MKRLKLPSDFSAFSAKIGMNPLQVQGPGGNTSFKSDGQMWIKASGTELAHAEDQDIFVLVDQLAAAAELNGSGDGSCQAAIVEPRQKLRPSIETTFHAIINWPVVVHTHSIVTLAHATSTPGKAALKDKLADLPFICVPYCKPGLDLSIEIQNRLEPDTQVIILENHGLIVAGNTVEAAANLQQEVERRLALTPKSMRGVRPSKPPPEGYEWASNGAQLGQNEILYQQVTAGSYYPDHVVFLGCGIPDMSANSSATAALILGEGLLVSSQATRSQRAMVQCLIDFFAAKPNQWVPEPIGDDAERALLNWDAEKYRQALAKTP